MEALYNKVRALPEPSRVLLPELHDPRVIEAAKILLAENLAVPVFESAPAEPIDAAVILNQAPASGEIKQKIHRCLESALAKKGADAISTAKEDPLYRAAAALQLGLSDVAISGSVATTGDVLRAGLKVIGLASDANIVSSYFLMEFNNRVTAFADCAVVPEPDVEQLADIAINTARNFQATTGETARVALLSFSSKGSAEHPRSQLVRAASERAKTLAPELCIDGELQFDAALVPDIGKRKAANSDVAGQANVFVFPSLEAANIGYKIAERVGGALAIGPILQGMAKPWMDLSRGCSARDIVNVAVIATLSG